MGTSVGKRQREQQKRERAQAKVERKAVRQAFDGDAIGGEATEDVSPRSESELMEDLGALHRAFEADELSVEDFEEHRDRIQAQFARLLR
jgi:hypothetical protein